MEDRRTTGSTRAELDRAAHFKVPEARPIGPVRVTSWSRAPRAGAPLGLTPDAILALQRTAGNAKVVRMLATSQPDTPVARVERMIADADEKAIQAITDEELAATSAGQRAGMIRVLTDLMWTDAAAEAAVLRLLSFRGEQAKVAERLDAIGYRKAVADAVDDPAMSARLKELLGDTTQQAAGPIAEALSSGDPKHVMAIGDFRGATPAQRLGLLRLMLSMHTSNTAEEAKMLDILASAGSGLHALMNDLKATGLTQSLFDHIDARPNKERLIGLLTPLKDADLDKDLAVFGQSFLAGVGATIKEGVASAVEHFSLGALIQGALQPILHPLDTLNTVVLQAEHAVKAPSLDRVIALLRDVAGTLALWLGVAALVAGGLTALLGATVVLIPGAAPIGVIAASLTADAAAMGIAFIAFSVAKLLLDIGQGGAATTAREREREAQQVGESATLLAVAAIFGRLVRLLGMFLRRFRKAATTPEEADPAKLAETADEAKKIEAQASRDTEAMKGKVGDKPPGAPDVTEPLKPSSGDPKTSTPKADAPPRWTVDPNAWKQSVTERVARIKELEKTDPARAKLELEALERDLAEIEARNAAGDANGRARVDPQVDAQVDAAFERLGVPRVKGRKYPRIPTEDSSKAVPGRPGQRLDLEHIVRKPGETALDALKRVREVIHMVIAETPLKAAWDAAVKDVLNGRPMEQLSDAEMLAAYKKAQPKFWDHVRADPAAVQWLNDHGFDVSANAAKLRVNAPLPEQQVRVSLDHVKEKASKPRLALDGANLKLEFHDPNSGREIVQMRHPELRPNAPAPPVAPQTGGKSTTEP